MQCMMQVVCLTTGCAVTAATPRAVYASARAPRAAAGAAAAPRVGAPATSVDPVRVSIECVHA